MAGTVYNQNDPAFVNSALNSVGSQYASLFGKDTSLLVEKLTNQMIFDSSPQQFADLKLLNMVPVESVNSDEWFFQEMGYQRMPIEATSAAGGAADPASQSFTVANIDTVATDMMVIYPSNEKGNIIDVDTATNTITVRPLTGGSVPAVAIGDSLSFMSPVEADGEDGFANQFRASIVERFNFIEMMSASVKYGQMELFKLQNNGTTSNYLQMEQQQFFLQRKIDVSNTFWNGERGEVTTASGKKAKVTGGVFPTMVAAGSPNSTSTAATLPDAFEDIVLNTEFGEYGAVRFAFMTPDIHRLLSKAYKEDLTRYRPDDSFALLNLNEINIGSSRIVLVPYTRFKDRASFPASFENRIFILDMKNMVRKQTWAERSGFTLDRPGGVPKNYKELWVDMNFGLQYHNPLAGGWVDVTL